MDVATIATIVTLVLSVVSSVVGAKYKQGKSKLAKISALLGDVVKAVQDDNVSEAECQKIAADAKAVLEAP
jgi:hypothetical protein